MAGIFGNLARGAVRATAGVLAGEQERRQREQQELILRLARERQEKMDALAAADRTRRTTLEDAANAMNGVRLGAAPPDPTALSGAMGGLDLGPRYEQVGGAYVDQWRTPQAQQNRERTYAERAAEAVAKRKAEAEAAAFARSQQEFDRRQGVTQRDAIQRIVAQRQGRPAAGAAGATGAASGAAGAAGQPPARVGPPPTEGERKAAALIPKAMEADRLLESIETPSTIENAWNSVTPNAWNTDDGQAWNNAATQFITAILRPESGASIMADEYEQARRQFIPMPGDSQLVREQKRAARLRAIEQLRTMGDRAVDVPAMRAKETPIEDRPLTYDEIIKRYGRP